jgi:integrase
MAYGSAPNKKAARKVERELEEQAEKMRPEHAYTINYLLDKWLEVARHAPSTKYDTANRLKNHVCPELGNETVAAITTERLDNFYLDQERQGSAPASIRRLHGMIRAAFQQAVRWGWIDRNPAVGVRLPEVPNPTPVSTSVDTIKRVIDAAPPDFASSSGSWP